MGVIPSLDKWRSAPIYLNDIFSFSKTVHNHLSYLQRILTFLENGGVTLKLKKLFAFAEVSKIWATLYGVVK